MPKKLVRDCAALVVLVCAPLAANAQNLELQQYVQRCQSELLFNAVDVPTLDCNEGMRFAGGGPFGIVNDYLVYKRVNDNVDLALACRWLDNKSGRSTKAGSVELLIHNRVNGATCFFSAKDSGGNVLQPVPAVLLSPTNFGPRPNAIDFWLAPSDLNAKLIPSNKNQDNLPSPFPDPNKTDPLQCVRCHSQGAFIASHDIVPFLAQYGLINNRRDTQITFTGSNYYHAVASNDYLNLGTDTSKFMPAFRLWNNIIYNNNVADCSGSCHTLGNKLDRNGEGSLFTVLGGIDRLIPSLYLDINLLSSSGEMPPGDEASDFRWLNLHVPGTGSNGVETENFADAKDPNVPQPVPKLLQNCDAPGNLEAHAVGVPVKDSFSSDQFALIPDRLKYFNLKDGLVCLNSDQEPGTKCHDYQVRYLCDANTDAWSNWLDADTNTSDDGDHEERWRFTGLCANPVAIQAHVFNGASSADIFGPNDRLSRVSRYGVNCNNIDQPSGQCSNYVVRFRACTSPTLGYMGHVASSWSNNQLTSTGSADNAAVRAQPYNPQWNSQQWELKPVPNTEYYWLRNTAADKYLNVTTQADGAAVVTYTLHTDWDSEKWILEKPLNGGQNGMRLKNVWSGRYLTVGDSGTFAPLYSQSLNTGWASQLWKIN